MELSDDDIVREALPKPAVRRCARCGFTNEVYSHGDWDCAECGQLHNAFGQQVRFRIDSDIPPPEFDPLDAGERWDED